MSFNSPALTAGRAKERFDEMMDLLQSLSRKVKQLETSQLFSSDDDEDRFKGPERIVPVEECPLGLYACGPRAERYGISCPQVSGKDEPVVFVTKEGRCFAPEQLAEVVPDLPIKPGQQMKLGQLLYGILRRTAEDLERVAATNPELIQKTMQAMKDALTASP